MGDREAFTLFLGGCIRRVVMSDFDGLAASNSGISVIFKGKSYDMAYILYKFYRCALVHDVELPKDIEFERLRASVNNGVSFSNRGPSFSLSTGDKIVLDYGWIDFLIYCLKYARCNADEFGINHYNFVPNDDKDKQRFAEETVSQYGITLGRLEILKYAVRRISPNVIKQCRDAEISEHFSALVRSGEINAGSIAGLSAYELSDSAAVIQPKGIEILRHIANSYQIVEA
jgi:hypothetical protein